jgi:hypothetical protein
MAESPLYNFYLQTTREELQTRRSSSNEEVIEFCTKDLEEIKRKCYRCVYFDYMLGERKSFFTLVACEKMYLREVFEQGNNLIKYKCYKIYDIYSIETELAFRLYIGMKEKKVYDPIPEGSLDSSLIGIEPTLYNKESYPFLATIYCLQKRNVNVFII